MGLALGVAVKTGQQELCETLRRKNVTVKTGWGGGGRGRGVGGGLHDTLRKVLHLSDLQQLVLSFLHVRTRTSS